MDDKESSRSPVTIGERQTRLPRKSPIIRFHRGGGPLQRDDDLLFYEDGTVEIRLTIREQSRRFSFSKQISLVDALLGYLLTSIRFFTLKSTYDQEEQYPSDLPLMAPVSAWQRSALDPIYVIRADVFNRHNEITFSYSRCPDNLWRLRMVTDKLFYSADRLQQTNGQLLDVVSDLLV